jgi:hypothetical protein
MAGEQRNHWVEECYRRAAEVRRLARESSRFLQDEVALGERMLPDQADLELNRIHIAVRIALNVRIAANLHEAQLTQGREAAATNECECLVAPSANRIDAGKIDDIATVDAGSFEVCNSIIIASTDPRLIRGIEVEDVISAPPVRESMRRGAACIPAYDSSGAQTRPCG